MKKRFGWSKNAMSLDTVITADNIVEIGEKLTVGSFKMLVGYRGEVALRLYKMLLKDLYCKQNPEYVRTDAYDYVQIACLYLCEHIGQKLRDIVIDRRNMQVDIKHACCSEVGHWFYKDYTEHRFREPLIKKNQGITIDQLEENNSEESYAKVDEIVSKMNLKQRTNDVLECYINGMGVCEISRTLNIGISTVWRHRKLLGMKYEEIVGVKIQNVISSDLYSIQCSTQELYAS